MRRCHNAGQVVLRGCTTSNFDEYAVYHDESDVAGYWHGILFVPHRTRPQLLKLLKDGRTNARFHYHVSLKQLDCDAGKIWNLLNCWVSVGVASLMHRTEGTTQKYYTGEKALVAEIGKISNAMGVRLIVFRLSGGLASLGDVSKKPVRFETTFRIGLKGGLNLFAGQGSKLCVISLHFDGYEHHGRHVDRNRIIDMMGALAPGAMIHKNATLDDRSSNHNRAGACQDYDDCQLLQLTDIFVSGFRTVLAAATCEPQRRMCEPFALVTREWNLGAARMKNSRWHGGIRLSEAHIENGDWQFSDLEPDSEDRQGKLGF